MTGLRLVNTRKKSAMALLPVVNDNTRFAQNYAPARTVIIKLSRNVLAQHIESKKLINVSHTTCLRSQSVSWSGRSSWCSSWYKYRPDLFLGLRAFSVEYDQVKWRFDLFFWKGRGWRGRCRYLSWIWCHEFDVINHQQIFETLASWPSMNKLGLGK